MSSAASRPESPRTMDPPDGGPVGKVADGGREWSVMVRVMGPPDAVTKTGERVSFRKGKSLELLCWLALNRERMSRSMARTAMWEVDVADATFSTVVSEMRRAVTRSAVDIAPGSVSSPTYSDELLLDRRVVSDYDVLQRSLAEFSDDECSVFSVLRCLRLVRGIPFCGANYGWPDLDGTTTRIAVTVLESSLAVAEWAVDRKRFNAATDALGAGLRVFPGHSDLLELQSRMLRHRRYADE